MAEDLTELRGEGWKRLLAAARRSLEQTGPERTRVFACSANLRTRRGRDPPA